MVEFALVLPVLLLLLLVAIDAGRLFYGYVSLHNAARIAANYAATHADDWPEANPTTNPAAYDAAIDRDTASLDCEKDINPPVFSPATAPPRGVGDGHLATVTLTCVFRPLTPIIGSVIGNAVTLTVTEAYPIRSGMLAGIPDPARASNANTNCLTHGHAVYRPDRQPEWKHPADARAWTMCRADDDGPAG